MIKSGMKPRTSGSWVHTHIHYPVYLIHNLKCIIWSSLERVTQVTAVLCPLRQLQSYNKFLAIFITKCLTADQTSYGIKLVSFWKDQLYAIDIYWIFLELIHPLYCLRHLLSLWEMLKWDRPTITFVSVGTGLNPHVILIRYDELHI